MLTESTEMYLITIYRLSDEAQRPAHVQDIAAHLDLHHSSVSEKVKRLVEWGFVENDPERGITLTDDGRRIALSVLRKHRLIKTFLVRMAEYPLDDVYDEACRLEHAISDKLADSLEKMLGNPEVDPHGYPIPSRDGSVQDLDYRSLNDYSIGDRVIVKRVDALQPDKLAYLSQLGLVPGAEITIEAILPFDGPLMLRLDDRSVAIAPSLAQEIDVEPM